MQGKTYDALVVFGQITTGIQGILSILVASVFVLASVSLTLHAPRPVRATVTAVEQGLADDTYMVTASYTHPDSGNVETGTFLTKQGMPKPVLGSDPGASLTRFGSLTVQKSWGKVAAYLTSGAVALTGLAYLAINVVAVRKNAAAIAGGLALLNVIARVVI